MILGHRGAKGEYLENSLRGFTHVQDLYARQALVLGDSDQTLAGIEFDVQLTADNELIVFHDDNLSRIYKHQARVDQLNFAEISRLSQTQILHLTSMPPLLKNYHHIELEIKTHSRTAHDKLIRSLSKTLSTDAFLALPITLTSFDVDLHAMMHHHPMLKNYRRGLLVEPETSSKLIDKPNLGLDAAIIASANKFGCSHISWHHSMLDAHVVQMCHNTALGVSAWTVNKAQEFKRLVNIGVDYVITDYPKTFMNV